MSSEQGARSRLQGVASLGAICTEHGSREQQMEKQFRFQDLEIWQKACWI